MASPAEPPPRYQYDAFFSYKRDRESDGWHEVVKNKLTYWLKQELQRQDVRIFFDSEEIRTGTRWQQKIVSALKTSRCIVCLWSPLYFQSRYCVSEWRTFLEREKLKNRDLVLPASYFDGETFPAEAKQIQFLDVSKFASTMPKFWETELAVDFETLLRQLARDLAALIRNSPDYDDTFPIVEVPENQVEREKTIGRAANG